MSDPNWYQVVEYFVKKLETETSKLAAKDNTRDEDMYAKGRIAAYKEVLTFKKTLETRAASSANNGPT